MKGMAKIYDRTSNQYNFKNQTLFSARLDIQDKDDQISDKLNFKFF